MFDKEKARKVLRKVPIVWLSTTEDNLLEALAECVSDEPQTIDRDALAQAMSAALGAHVPSDWMMKLPYALADAALALLRPDPRIAKIADEPATIHL